MLPGIVTAAVVIGDLSKATYEPYLPSTQTTIMAVQYDGGVIMGADSRTSTGTYVANRVSDKITSLHDHIYACRSGSAADTQAITDYVRYFLSSHRLVEGKALSTCKGCAKPSLVVNLVHIKSAFAPLLHLTRSNAMIIVSVVMLLSNSWNN